MELPKELYGDYAAVLRRCNRSVAALVGRQFSIDSVPWQPGQRIFTADNRMNKSLEGYRLDALQRSLYDLGEKRFPVAKEIFSEVALPLCSRPWGGLALLGEGCLDDVPTVRTHIARWLIEHWDELVAMGPVFSAAGGDDVSFLKADYIAISAILQEHGCAFWDVSDLAPAQVLESLKQVAADGAPTAQ